MRLSAPLPSTSTGLFWLPPEAAAAATSHQVWLEPTSVPSPRPSMAPRLPSAPRVPMRPAPEQPKVMNGAQPPPSALTVPQVLTGYWLATW